MVVALTNLFESVQQDVTRMSLGDVIWITYRTQSAGIQGQSFEAFDETEIAPAPPQSIQVIYLCKIRLPPASPGSSSSLPPAVPLTVVFLSLSSSQLSCSLALNLP